MIFFRQIISMSLKKVQNIIRSENVIIYTRTTHIYVFYTQMFWHEQGYQFFFIEAPSFLSKGEIIVIFDSENHTGWAIAPFAPLTKTRLRARLILCYNMCIQWVLPNCTIRTISLGRRHWRKRLQYFFWGE